VNVDSEGATSAQYSTMRRTAEHGCDCRHALDGVQLVTDRFERLLMMAQNGTSTPSLSWKEHWGGCRDQAPVLQTPVFEGQSHVWRKANTDSAASTRRARGHTSIPTIRVS